MTRKRFRPGEKKYVYFSLALALFAALVLIVPGTLQLQYLDILKVCLIGFVATGTVVDLLKHEKQQIGNMICIAYSIILLLFCFKSAHQVGSFGWFVFLGSALLGLWNIIRLLWKLFKESETPIY